MRLCYYSDSYNVGDALNAWLWPQLFEELEDFHLVGIGSILSYSFLKTKPELDDSRVKKIVFGSGARSEKLDFKFGLDWEIRFLRGPLSSATITKQNNNFITDSAYAIALLPQYSALVTQQKKYEISLVPYFRSMKYFDWKMFTRQTGVHIIPSTLDCTTFITEVSQSKLVIAEAMHGAIIADILRVPWLRLKLKAHHFEQEATSEFKWSDWLLSMTLKNKTFSIQIPHHLSFTVRYFPLFIQRYINTKLLIRAIQRSSSKTTSYQLSIKHIFNQKVTQLKKEVDWLRQHYSN
ncbi:MAG: hypothetical protein R8N23_17630 [Reichenbachiella sp.]|uniref:hypothetical protein n=1 Tax=Reichenbachiella sp. TaxID=2184521 RepID=UPI00296624CE|nr:hypothetical protein [Reichenbachiella sp.]MDW3211693.1 hypothetical protein [Reichenbachiella sp.]